jgi:NAD(P)H-nitrite reductase large subunit
MQKLVIIGNGIAGITTAIEVRKRSSIEILVISEETEFFFSRTALMYVYMGHMKFEHTQPYEKNFWEKNKISLKQATVQQILPKKNCIETTKNEKIPYDFLVIATGSKPNRFGWPGQDLKGVSGLYHKADLDNLIQNSDQIKKGVVVGGGLIGIELAEMLRSRKKEVSFLVREEAFWNMVLSNKEARIIENHIRAHGVDLQMQTELKEILGNDLGKAEKVITNKNDEIEAQFVGLTVGVSPNIDFLRGSEILINKGILVNKFLETNIENVYAIGDCAEQTQPQIGRRSIEAVWYTGKIMGETLAKTICGQKTAYQPGNWFNSAKFFDIEYQTYGLAAPKISEIQNELYWQNSNGDKSIRLVYEIATGTFTGVNVLGIRLRQSFFEKVLNQKLDIAYVMDHLEEANFDPEFYRNHLKEIKNMSRS